MPRTLSITLCAVAIAIAGISLRAQSVDDAAAFEVASIKPSPPLTGGPFYLTFGSQPGGRWVSQNATFLMILRSAYREFSLPGQVVGPDWINTDRFDINAKAAGDPTREEMAAMLRRLLSERFKLKVHTEFREVDAFALVLARSDGRLGPNLHRSTVDCAAIAEARKKGGASPEPPSQPGKRPECGLVSYFINGFNKMAGGGRPISAVVNGVQGTAGRPVVDRTGLSGTYDFELEFAPTEAGPNATTDPSNAPPTVFTALQEQLGLKLEPRRERMEVLVIDSVERPTAN